MTVDKNVMKGLLSHFKENAEKLFGVELSKNAWNAIETQALQERQKFKTVDDAIKFVVGKIEPHAAVAGKAEFFAEGSLAAVNKTMAKLREDRRFGNLGFWEAQGERLAAGKNNLGKLGEVTGFTRAVEGAGNSFKRAGKWALGAAAVIGGGILLANMFGGSKKPVTGSPAADAAAELAAERESATENFAPAYAAAPNTMMGMPPQPGAHAARVRGVEAPRAFPEPAMSFQDAATAARNSGSEPQLSVS